MPDFYECHKATAGVVDLAWEAAVASNEADTDFKRADRLIVAILNGEEPFGWDSATTDRLEELEYKRDKEARKFAILSDMAAVVMKRAVDNPFAKDQIHNT
jgi:hypothetical protein